MVVMSMRSLDEVAYFQRTSQSGRPKKTEINCKFLLVLVISCQSSGLENPNSKILTQKSNSKIQLEILTRKSNSKS